MRLGSNIIVLSLATRISFAEATFFFHLYEETNDIFRMGNYKKRKKAKVGRGSKIEDQTRKEMGKQLEN